MSSVMSSLKQDEVGFCLGRILRGMGKEMPIVKIRDEEGPR